MPTRTRSVLAPMVSSTKLAESSTSKPTKRLNRSPARNALHTPADRTRYVGRKIDTGDAQRAHSRHALRPAADVQRERAVSVGEVEQRTAHRDHRRQGRKGDRP